MLHSFSFPCSKNRQFSAYPKVKHEENCSLAQDVLSSKQSKKYIDDTTFTILMNFPCYSVYRVTEYYVQLEFMDEELYKKTRTRLYDTKHNSIIAISGDWKKVNFNTSPKPTKSRCIIYSDRQIAVIQRG